jgi:hypothetical protein
VESVIAGVLGAVLGALASGYFALRAARLQVDVVLQQVRGSVHDRLYETNRSLLEYLGTHAKLRPYFYDNKPLSDCTDDAERSQIMLIAEMYAGLLQLAALYLPDLPDSLRNQWKGWIVDTYKLSPAVQHYFSEFGRWHSPVLLDMLPQGISVGQATSSGHS